MGVFNVEGWDSTKISVYFNYDCNFFQETYTFNHVLYPSKVQKKSSMKSNPFNPGQTYDLSVKNHVFLGQKMVLPRPAADCFRRSFAFVPGVGAMLRAWLSGSTSPLAPWWMKNMEIMDMAYILDGTIYG